MRPAFLGCVLAICVALSRVSAQLPLARLLWVSPPGAAAGTTNEISVGGSDLDDAVALRFSDPRVTASPKPGISNRFLVVVPSEVPPGLLDVRLAGRFGLSNPRAFAVGFLPERVVPPTNTVSGSALELDRASLVNSRVEPNSSSWFRFQVAAGEHLGIQVDASVLDSRLVPEMTVFSADGTELARSRRRERLDFIAPAAGMCLLRLSDSMFRGGEVFQYRLSIGTGPHVDFALPQVLTAGRTQRVTLFGRNLPGGTAAGLRAADGFLLDRLDLEVAAPSEPGPSSSAFPGSIRPASTVLARDLWTWRWNWAGDGLRAIPVEFSLSPLPVAVHAGTGTVAVVPPCEFSGLFPERGQLSGVTFVAKAGEVFWIEVFADRNGLPCDAHGVVQRERSTRDAHGGIQYADVAELADTDQNLGDREFNTTSRDAAIRFEANTPGTYRILVRDLFQSGPVRTRLPYRLSLRRETPDLHLVAFPAPPARVGEDRNVHVLPLSLRRGETVAVKVLALRRDGFNGEIGLTASNLPPGVTASMTRIRPDQNSGTVLLSAADEARGAVRLDLLGMSSPGGTPRTTPASGASVTWAVPDFNNEAVVSRRLREPTVAVIESETAPVSVAPIGAGLVSVPEGGRLSVPLAVVRQPDFQAAFNLRLAGHPALEKAKEFPIAEKATNAVAEWVLTEFPLPPGRHTLWLQGSVAGKYRNQPEAVGVADAALKLAEKAVAEAAPDARPQAEERRKSAEAARKAAEERAKPRDVTVALWSRPFVVEVTPKTAVPEAAK